MGTHSKKYYVICLHDEWGFDFEPYSHLRDIVEGAKPNYWEFMNPGTVLIYFISKAKNQTKIEQFIRNVHELIRKDERLQKLSIGRSEGELIVETNIWGTIKSSPIGSASSEAIKNAQK